MRLNELQAERDAQKIVQKCITLSVFCFQTSPSCMHNTNPTTTARTYRTQRVRDARSEAQKEIEEYKAQKEAEFKKFEAEHSGSNAKLEEQIAKESEGTLQKIKAAGEKSGQKVIEDLIKGVTEVWLTRGWIASPIFLIVSGRLGSGKGGWKVVRLGECAKEGDLIDEQKTNKEVSNTD